jgi:hypothetical protein
VEKIKLRNVNYNKLENDLEHWEQERLKAEIEADKKRASGDTRAVEIWEASIVYCQRQVNAIRALIEEEW